MPLLCSDGRTGAMDDVLAPASASAGSKEGEGGRASVSVSMVPPLQPSPSPMMRGEMERVRGEQKVIRALVPPPPPPPQPFLPSSFRSLKIHPGPFQWRRGGEWGRRNESSHLEILLWRDEGRGKRSRGDQVLLPNHPFFLPPPPPSPSVG